jgi:hypothetical protein
MAACLVAADGSETGGGEENWGGRTVLAEVAA